MGDVEAGARDCRSGKGPVVIQAPTKARSDARKKVAEELDGHWEELTDADRSTVAVDKIGDLRRAIQAIRTHFKKQGFEMVARPDNRFEQPTGMGYRDIKLLFEAPNGRMVEVQVHVKAMVVAKQELHPLYRENQNIMADIRKRGKATPEQLETLKRNTERMRRGYGKAWEASQ